MDLEEELMVNSSICSTGDYINGCTANGSKFASTFLVITGNCVFMILGA